MLTNGQYLTYLTTNVHDPIAIQHFTLVLSESDGWSTEEIESYHQALLKCDKDFFKISKEVRNTQYTTIILLTYLILPLNVISIPVKPYKSMTVKGSNRRNFTVFGI